MTHAVSVTADDGRLHEAVLVTGPPGAGKSVVCEQLVSLMDPSAYVAGDLFFGFVRNGYIDPWRPEAGDQNQVVTEAAALATGRLTSGFHVVYDGVIEPEYLPKFMDVAGLPSVHYVVLLPPLAVCAERVASRTDHGFTDLDATADMWRKFERSLDGLERHVLDGLASPESLARQIAGRVMDGSLCYQAGPDRSP